MLRRDAIDKIAELNGIDPGKLANYMDGKRGSTRRIKNRDRV
jgi:hypothetical protein